MDLAGSDGEVDAVEDVLGAFLGGRGGARRMAGRLLGGLGGASRRRGTTSRAEQRLTTAHHRLQDELAELEDLELELATELADITEAWDARAGEIGTVEIDLEKADVDVDQVVLAWLPVR